MGFLIKSGDGRNRNAVLYTLKIKDYTLIQFF
jgi:hypothetical protein